MLKDKHYLVNKPDFNTKPDVIFVSKTDDCSFTNKWYEIASSDHFWMQWRFLVFKNLLKNIGAFPREKLRVLEVGCGTGVFLKQMEQVTNWEIDGADINLGALKASVAGKSRLLFYDIMERNSDFKEAYDIIFLMDVLEHIQEPHDFLDACFFHIRPRGVFVFNVPALQDMYSVYDEVMGHFRRYNKKKMLEEFESIKECRMIMRYWGFTMLPLLFLRKLLISNNARKEDIIIKGFDPPGRFNHTILKGLMYLDCVLFKNPPIGTSLMGAVFAE